MIPDWMCSLFLAGWYQITSAKLELHLSEFLSMNRSGLVWAKWHMLPEIWRVDVEQQPYSFNPGKLGADPCVPQLAHTGMDLLGHLVAWGHGLLTLSLASPSPSVSLNSGPNAITALAAGRKIETGSLEVLPMVLLLYCCHDNRPQT